MKITTNNYSYILRLISRIFKYFLLLIFGFSCAYLISMSVGTGHIANMLMPFIFSFFYRTGIIVLLLMGLAILWESIR